MEGDDKSRELQNPETDVSALEGGPRTTGASRQGDTVPPTPPPAEMADGGITPQNIEAMTGQVLARPPRTEDPPSRESQKRAAANASRKSKSGSKEELKVREQVQNASKDRLDLVTETTKENVMTP